MIEEYRGYEIHCDEDGVFSAKKTSEAFEFQDYKELSTLENEIEEEVTGRNSRDVSQLIVGIILGMLFSFVLLALKIIHI